jgi:hypothetical protein
MAKVPISMSLNSPPEEGTRKGKKGNEGKKENSSGP